MLKVILLLSLVAIATCSLFGGYVDEDEYDPDVILAAIHAAETLSHNFASKYHHILKKVVKAETQDVAGGTNYRLTIIVGETDCRKGEVKYDDTFECDFHDTISTYKKCTVVVYKDLNESHKLVSSGCILASKKEV